MNSMRSSASRVGRLQIGRLVDPGVAVPAAAELLDDALHLVAGDVRRALEVHVLDPVRHTGQARASRPSSRRVPAPHRRQRRGVDLLHEDLQTIREVVPLTLPIVVRTSEEVITRLYKALLEEIWPVLVASRLLLEGERHVLDHRLWSSCGSYTIGTLQEDACLSGRYLRSRSPRLLTWALRRPRKAQP